MTEYVYIFLHNPKTGGTTFNGHCVKHLEMHTEFVHFGPFGRKAQEAAGLPAFAKRDEALRRRARVLAGHRTWFGMHELVPGRVPRYVTFLREPAARLVSKYNGFMTRKKNEGSFRAFDDWYRDEPRDEMTAIYTRFARRGDDGEPDLAAAKGLLDEMWYVGITERLDDSLRFLFGEIGIDPEFERMKVTGQKRDGDLSRMDREIPRLVSLDDALKQRIERDNRLDVELYRHARELHDRGPSDG